VAPVQVTELGVLAELLWPNPYPPVAWLDTRHPGDRPATIADDLLVSDPDPELRRRVSELEDTVVGRQAGWDGRGLAAALQRDSRRGPAAGPASALPH
jgi:hypothetical protein